MLVIGFVNLTLDSSLPLDLPDRVIASNATMCSLTYCLQEHELTMTNGRTFLTTVKPADYGKAISQDP
jgi:hypothetical protein